MNTKWRLLDTGVLSAARNMAWDQALVSVRGRGKSLNTVRFLQFSPAAALAGAYQVAEQEIRLDYCRERGINVNRRITGGGSLLFDETQLGWELIAGKRDFDFRPMSLAFHRMVCEACVLGLRGLGVEAAFRPRNDIEVNGRKISGTGGAEEGEAFLFQGTLLLDFDVEAMMKALRIPTEKLKQSSLDSAADRVTWVAKELGALPPLVAVKAALARGFEQVFGIELESSPPTEEEEEEYRRLTPHFESDEWVYGQRVRPSAVGILSGLHRSESNTVRAHLSIDEERKTLRSVLFTGDYFVSPRRTIFDLESRLKDARLDAAGIAETIRAFWNETQPQSEGLSPDGLCQAVRGALDELELAEFGFSLSEIEKTFCVNGSPREILRNGVDVVLLPYCAKLSYCAYRHEEDCICCGMCSFGETYAAAQEAKIPPVSIVSFEHLMETLAKEKRRGARGFLGSCCKAFYNKHYKDFQDAGLPGILADLNDTTCYDLNQARSAYAGEFEGQTEMDTALMDKLIATAARLRKEKAGERPKN